MTGIQTKRTRLPRATALATCLAIALAGGSLACADAGNALSTTQLQHANYVVAKSAPVRRPGARNGRMPAQGWNQALSILAARTASVVPVLNCNDSGPGSLREAALNAVVHAEIDLQSLSCSTISLTSGAITTSASELTLTGPGSKDLTIAGNGSDSILVANDLIVTGLTLYNGTDPGGSGGCIYASGALTLIDSVVTKCHSGGPTVTNGYGGGVMVLDNLIMIDSAITYSTVQGFENAHGAGAFVYGRVDLYDSSISGNIAQGGEKAYGAGIFVEHGDAFLTNSSIVSNTARAHTGNAAGGGIRAIDGVELTSSTVAKNEASSNNGSAMGGGISIIEGWVELSQDSSVTENRAYSVNGSALGGGISTIEGNVSVSQDSRVTDNVAQSKRNWVTGGGISAGTGFSFPGNIVLEHSVLSGNTAMTGCNSCSSYGGGAHAVGKIAADDSEISGNTLTTLAASNAHAFGGGLSTLREGFDGSLVVVNSTVSGNASIGGGGSSGSGIAGGIGGAANSPVELHSSTVAFNRATTHSGGVKVGKGAGSNWESYFTSSIVALNEAPIGADIGSSIVQVIDGSNNLVMQAAASVTLPADTLNIDPLLQPLAANGSNRHTHAITESSPAFDTGIDIWGIPPVYDQRGQPYLRKSGAAEDIGAFELQVIPDCIFVNDFELSPASCS